MRFNGELPDFLDGGASHQGLPPPRQGRAWWLVGGVCGVLAAAALALHLAGVIPPRHARTASPPSSHRSTPPAGARPTAASSALPPAWKGPMPYPVLIADSGHHRLLEVTPAGRVVWQFPLPASAGVALQPSDLSFSPHGRGILVAAERQDVVERVDYAAKRVVWTFGVPGHAGAGAHHLNYPDDPATLPDGDIALADIRNCREVILSAAGRMLTTWGKPQSNYCLTDPARGLYGYPNGSEPQPNGDILLTFSSGDRVAMLSPTGKVRWNVIAADLFGGFASDAVLGPGGEVIVCGYGSPGAVVAFNPHTGVELWHYSVAGGPGALSDPTEALPLPGGNVLVADSGNNRVVAINPTTGRIVWTYATGLSDPGGVALDVYRNWQAPAAGGAPAAARVGVRGAPGKSAPSKAAS